ncbi:MAG: 30S ribosomal protein S5 [Nanobdellota archaeon]
MQSKRNKKDNKRKSAPTPSDTKADLDTWKPRTELGRMVKSGEVKNIDEVLGKGTRILETEIVDSLLTVESDLLLIGQAKGKFGGGQRRVFRQTQKKTREGNKPKFATFAVVGDRNGHVGVGYGKSKETVPAREKAFQQAKLNILMVRRGTGSWEDVSTEPHSIPFTVEGSCGSYSIKLMPAPKGKGLVCDHEVAKILALAGIKNVWSKSFGQKKNKINVIKATVAALKKLSSMSVHEDHVNKLAIVDGAHSLAGDSAIAEGAAGVGSESAQSSIPDNQDSEKNTPKSSKGDQK